MSNVKRQNVKMLICHIVYEDQYAWVRWGTSKSSVFSIVNGTRQGSVLSPALFALYVDGLLQELRALGVGCHIGGVFMGAVEYCDDVLRDTQQGHMEITISGKTIGRKAAIALPGCR